jgi:hypothetical protein
MTTVRTAISGGYRELIKTFFDANGLDVKILESDNMHNHLMLIYEDGSDTAYQITFMSVKHLGFENMLCDYLIRCGVNAERISLGRVEAKRDMKELDEMWEKHRRNIGLA